MFSADQAFLMEKIEASYGVDATPGALTDAILTSKAQITPLDGNVINRELDGPKGGADPSIISAINVALSFEIELAASGTSGAGITAPAWSPSLQACGMDENVITDVGSERVEFTPSDLSDQSVLTSVSSYCNYSGIQHVILGSRGGWGIRLQNGIPKLTFNRRGLYVDPTDVAFPVADFSAYQDPLPVDNDNTPTIDLFGFSCAMFSMEINSGITPQIINIPGNESVHIPKREITGKIVIAAPAIADHDFFADAKNHTLGALAFQHGVNAGEICAIDADGVQVLNPRYGNQQDIRTLEMDLRFTDKNTTEFMLTTK